ncbi:hypothetical protein PHET_08030 [Paragonimus heterotremus]|uniref:Uncharacterized protein n=1 Tax=Paragonimus heterotremus TaxID=100268 RepID=A0A8J4TGT1_9TREM|nr:hypothetical protein PHET_08030 [Paragonimus heterotremus]
MGCSWLRNLVGYSLTEDELKDIPNPRTELLFHVTFRSVQLTSFVGFAIVAPVVTLIKQPRTLITLRTRVMKYAVYGLIPGTVLGPALYYARMRHQPEEGYFDRCYRLRHNKNQVRIDRMSILGALAGGFIGVLTPYGAIEAAVLGMYSGILLASAYSYSPCGC